MRLFIIFLLLFSIPAKANLLFKNNCPHKQIFLQIYQRLPKIKSNIIVEELFPLDWKKKYPKDWKRNVEGFYDEESNEVHVENAVKEPVPFIFTHEIGHWYFYNKLTRTQRNNWRYYWLHNKGKMPSKYALVDSSEGFAECFAEAYASDYMPSRYKRNKQVKRKILSYFNDNK